MVLQLFCTKEQLPSPRLLAFLLHKTCLACESVTWREKLRSPRLFAHLEQEACVGQAFLYADGLQARSHYYQLHHVQRLPGE
jgi:hypothetical protein